MSNIDKFSKISNSIKWKNKQHHSKILLNSFPMNLTVNGSVHRIKSSKALYHARFHSGSQRVKGDMSELKDVPGALLIFIWCFFYYGPDDNFRSGCRNVIQSRQEQSFSEPPSKKDIVGPVESAIQLDFLSLTLLVLRYKCS